MTTDKKVDALNTLAAAFFRASIAMGKTDDMAEALLSAAKALRAQEEREKFSPPCYQPDGDGCAYQCYDGQDEPIDKCKECPLCYSDKQRHREESNELLTMDDLRYMDGEAVYMVYEGEGGPLDGWVLVEVDSDDKGIWLTNNLGGRSEYTFDEGLEDGLKLYKRKPEEVRK